MCASFSAEAACSRKMNVPMATTGLSVMAQGNDITGIYPEMLRNIASKEDCIFTMSLVPRARLELLFENGQADILIPATHTPKRDEIGTFIPLIHNRATLISIQSNRPALKSLQELIAQRNARVVLVRGYDYGPVYQSLVTELSRQARLSWEADPVSVARVLKAGAADYTIMASSIFAGAIQGDARVDDLSEKTRYEALAELPWGESGLYLSKKSLSPEDKQVLQDIFERAANSGIVWKSFQRYYKAEVLKDGIRP
ncbi:MAG: transporter substrate-binding domain-containing protein [Burkholderiales bacterium]|nr:transporter substrate-binding domain-containing protein [Burkholderiales bacterium]